jgi:hypothetical protein
MIEIKLSQDLKPGHGGILHPMAILKRLQRRESWTFLQLVIVTASTGTLPSTVPTNSCVIARVRELSGGLPLE